MTSFGVRPLDEAAWPDFAQLVLMLAADAQHSGYHRTNG